MALWSGTSRGLAERFVWVAILVAVVCGVLLTAYRVFVSPAGRVIREDPQAPWIMAAEPFSAMNRQWGRERAPLVRFEREWTLSEIPARAPLRVRVFGGFELRVNDVEIEVDSAVGRRWQVFQTFDVAAALRAGENRIIVDVRNPRGPALLSLSLEVGSRTIVSDQDFAASLASRSAESARPAEDIRRHPAAVWLPRPGHGVAEHRYAILLALGLGAGATLALGRRSAWLGARLPWITLAGVGLFWLLVFVLKLVEAPLSMGFDARAHLDYVAQLSEGRLPLATDGWSTYHPPLYHLIVSALAPLGDVLGERFGVIARRLPAWLSGVGLVLLSGRLARVLHPGQPGLRASAMAFAALLPMNVYIAAAIGNEGLLALLAAGAVVWGSELLGEKKLGTMRVVAVSCWLGLALLTKYTALVAVAIVGTSVLLRIGVSAGLSAAARLRAGLFLALPAVLLSGWFYARNWVIYGRALVPNWDLPGSARVWWSPPGFHTPAYYTGFGRSLEQPYYSAFSSFLDGLYSTTFGDGLLSGAPGLIQSEVPWNLEWMAVIYWAAVPVVVLVVIGAGTWLREALQSPDPYRRAALAMPLVYFAAMGFAIFYATLTLPFFGQARASYGLSVTPILALSFARGLASVDSWRGGWVRRGIRVAFGALLGVYALAVILAFLA